MKYKLTLTVLLSLCIVFAYSQEQKTQDQEVNESIKKTKKKKNGIIWIPVLASSPANGFMLGVAPALNWKMYDSEKTSYSSMLGSLVWTTKKQFLFTLKGNVYFKDNQKHAYARYSFF